MVKKILSNKIILLANIAFVCLILYGIITACFLSSVERSFWLDESFLASSVSNRSFVSLFTAGELDYMQSAPIGWLYIEKIVITIFGNSEVSLRAISLLSYILILFALVFIQCLYRSKVPFAAAAIFANLRLSIQYSNVFKQYEFEALITLVILITFILYRREYIKFIPFLFTWMILIWFSNSACFIEGGILLAFAVNSLIYKDKKLLCNFFIIGTCIVASFAIYFLVWANSATDVKGMQEYWMSQFFNFFPRKPKDIITFNKNLSSIFQISSSGLLMAWIFAGAFFFTKYKKSRTLYYSLFSLLLLLIASSLHLYPIEKRLLLFFYPLLILSYVDSIELFLFSSTKLRNVFLSITLLYVAYFCGGVEFYSKEKNFFWKGEELYPSIKYLNENIKNDELIYVYKHSVPTFEYINGYKKDTFLKTGSNVLLGQVLFNNGQESSLELDRIFKYRKLYVIFSHLNFRSRFDTLMRSFHLKGYLDLVLYENNTPLYFFSLDKKFSKYDYRFEILNREQKWGLYYTTIRIHNTGLSYLSDPYNRTYLFDVKGGDLYEFPELVAPKKYVDIIVSYPKDAEPIFTLKRQHGENAINRYIQVYKMDQVYTWEYDLIKRINEAKFSSDSFYEFRGNLSNLGVSLSFQQKKLMFELSPNVYYLKTGNKTKEKLMMSCNAVYNKCKLLKRKLKRMDKGF